GVENRRARLSHAGGSEAANRRGTLRLHDGPLLPWPRIRPRVDGRDHPHHRTRLPVSRHSVRLRARSRLAKRLEVRGWSLPKSVSEPPAAFGERSSTSAVLTSATTHGLVLFLPPAAYSGNWRARGLGCAGLPCRCLYLLQNCFSRSLEAL